MTTSSGRPHATIFGAMLLFALIAGCDDDNFPLPPAAAFQDAGTNTDRGSAGVDAPGASTDQRTSADGGALGDAGLVDSLQVLPDGAWPDFGHCTPVIPQNPRDAWALRLPSAGFGGIEVVGQSVYLKSPNDLTRIGVRLDWGGTVTFFGLTGNARSNVIDDNDTGRELQIALYDQDRRMQGCAATASCPVGACPSEQTFLGWNPVQGGDQCGNGVQATHRREGDSLAISSRPIQWNPDWDKSSCVESPCPSRGVEVKVIYATELRYVSEHVVEVSHVVKSEDSVDHYGAGQEWPTMYVSFGKDGDPDLLRLLDANRQLIHIGGQSGIYLVQNFTSPRPWVTFQNASEDYGVGLAMDQGTTGFQGWAGGPGAPYFHNVRARADFNLPAGKEVRGRSYVALGGFDTVKSELEAVLAKRPPFGWLDVPASMATTYAPGQPVEIQGWVLDSAKVGNVEVQIDGVKKASIPVAANRGDVCTVYPTYAGCPNVGYRGSVSTAGLSVDCPHLLRVIATDGQGNTSVLGERKLVPSS